MTAILPGAALQELWRVVGVVENLLLGISIVVIFTTLIGMTAIMFSSLSERRREMAIWRAMGASPRTVVGLLMLEAIFISVLSILLSVILLFFSLSILLAAISYPTIARSSIFWVSIFIVPVTYTGSHQAKPSHGFSAST